MASSSSQNSPQTVFAHESSVASEPHTLCGGGHTWMDLPFTRIERGSLGLWVGGFRVIFNPVGFEWSSKPPPPPGSAEGGGSGGAEGVGGGGILRSDLLSGPPVAPATGAVFGTLPTGATGGPGSVCLRAGAIFGTLSPSIAGAIFGTLSRRLVDSSARTAFWAAIRSARDACSAVSR